MRYRISLRIENTGALGVLSDLAVQAVARTGSTSMINYRLNLGWEQHEGDNSIVIILNQPAYRWKSCHFKD